MGASGSGKSTLLHCLAGIYSPDEGEVWFDGRRLDTRSDAERTVLRRTAFGFVFQFGQLVPELSAADNVALPLLLNRVKRKAAYEQAVTWLDRLDLGGLLADVRGPSTLLAGRRLVDNPRAAVRTVSGLTMAVFIGTAIAVLLPGLLTRPGTGGDPTVRDVLRIQYGEGGDPNDGLSANQSTAILQTLSTYPGATAVPLYLLPADRRPRLGPKAGPPPGPSDGPPANSIVDCEQIARLPGFGRCAPGTARVTLAASDLFTDNAAAVTLPIVDAANRPYTGSTDQLRVGTLLVGTDDPVTLERVRTYLTTHASITPPVTGPQGWSINALVPATFGEIAATRQAVYDALEHIAFAAVALTLLVAGCSLAVSAGGGILERRRPFTLLRLTGTPLSSLARVVLLESVLPLLAAAVVAAGTGWALAATVATSLSNSALPFPGWPYVATIGAGLMISLAVMLLTLPLLGRLTRTQTARFE